MSELESLRNEHPFRERLVGHHVLALYRSGRPADALRVMEKFRRRGREAAGIEPTPALLRLEERVLLHDESIQPRGADVAAMPTLVEAANPYKGLRPFAPADTGTFFGRDALVAELLRAVGSGRNLVALVGASGSGKSSVVRAGLIPALAKGAIDDSDGWLVASMMPGAHPFAELEGALLKTVIDAADSLDEQLRDGDDGLIRSALRRLPDEDARWPLLVIDQFEELFSMVDDDAVRDRFLSNLVAAIDDPHDRITVLVTLRADFCTRRHFSTRSSGPAWGAESSTSRNSLPRSSKRQPSCRPNRSGWPSNRRYSANSSPTSATSPERCPCSSTR